MAPSHDEMPLLHDPSCPGTSFNHRWEEPKYQTFKKKSHDYAVWARQALDLQDVDPPAAIAAWQKLFGPEFAAHAVTDERAHIVEAKALKALRASAGLEEADPVDAPAPAPGEEFIQDKLRVERRYDAHINAVILGTYNRSLRKARVVRTGHKLRFRLSSDVPGDYEVWWKVRNRGHAAERAGQLRGQIVRQGNDGRNQHTESTLYPGRHYIEAYVMKSGVVMASDHHEVHII